MLLFSIINRNFILLISVIFNKKYYILVFNIGAGVAALPFVFAVWFIADSVLAELRKPRLDTELIINIIIMSRDPSGLHHRER